MKEKVHPVYATPQPHVDVRQPAGTVQRAVDESPRMAAQAARIARLAQPDRAVQLAAAPELLQISPEQAVPMPSSMPSLSGRRVPLPDNLRGSMEASFKQDFSSVRVHLSDMPTAIGARALTRGDEITMPARHYQPGSVAGRKLLGHELAHVVQQRAGRVASGRGVLDHHGFEADADRHGERAASMPLGGAALRPGRYASARSPGKAMPFQPGWEFVEVGNRVRKYNLATLPNGNWLHTATNTEYYHAPGKMHATLPGVRVLSPVSTAGAAPTVPVTTVAPTLSHDPKNVLFGFEESGKVKYLGNSAPNRTNYAGQYHEMEPAMFSIFKNAGKRGASTKVMDPVDLKRYSYDDVAKQFYEWDKKKTNRRGAAISAMPASPGVISQNQALLDRLAAGELVDRRRADRSSENLSPFDVGPYKSNVTMASDSDASVSRTYPMLSGITAWTTASGDVNRDHSPSGESLNQRGDAGAYNQGFTIAIPNPEMHQIHSPTFGTDNSHKNGLIDDLGGTPMRRVLLDAQEPALAAYRDTHFMLTQTQGQNYSASAQHPWLDLTKPENRLRQIGGYRNLHHRNTQIFKRKGSKRGFDPSSPGWEFAAQPRGVTKSGKKPKTKRLGAFKYTKTPNKTQGALAVEKLLEHMRATGRTHLI